MGTWSLLRAGAWLFSCARKSTPNTLSTSSHHPLASELNERTNETPNRCPFRFIIFPPPLSFCFIPSIAISCSASSPLSRSLSLYLYLALPVCLILYLSLSLSLSRALPFYPRQYWIAHSGLHWRPARPIKELGWPLYYVTIIGENSPTASRGRHCLEY